ncbi:helix-turn-helix domain-containing protein [Polaromonas jejuensis]|uniref:Helix-turn-helix domain-containing protein n=1 Tax=Polaromonas jejuensis TaxID=457502 RepID=A0ABW0QBA1_9BURK|nr:helix-turn-helix domain-containing protein [Polaromonas jejuensis]
MVRRSIPHYDLYGDQAVPGWSNSFNFEWIPERSGPNNWEIQPHVHDAFVQLLYLTQGTVQVQLDSARHFVRAPCLLVVPARTVHGLHFSPDVQGAVVTATQKPLESLASVLMSELLPVIRTPTVLPIEESSRHADALMPLFLAVEREYRHPASGQVAAGMSLLTALLVQVARIQDSLQTATPSITSRKSAQIERFRALVDARFRTRLTVDACASELGVTAGQLTRLCREVLGISSLDVINARIVHEAQRDLVYTSTTVKQLAAALGFDDEAYFSRFFRKQTGQTPREFRASVLAQMSGTAAAPVVLPSS